MTPVPLDLPLRPPEAAELARLVFEHAERRPLTGEVRNRVAGCAAVLGLKTIRPYFGSLAREPIHHSTYYLAVDGLAPDPDAGVPLLLHMAPGSAPTSGIFARALLIGRIGGAVINAIPFGPSDDAAIEQFVSRVDPAFLPRAQGSRPAIAVESDPPAAFQAFRAVLKRTGKNLAATAQSYYPAIWAAIRDGWREGWSAGIDLGDPPDRDAIRRHPGFSRFTVAGTSPEAAAQTHEWIRQVRSASGIVRPFDFEVSLESSATPTTAAEIVAWLEEMKTRGHAPKLLAPRLAGIPGLEELAAAARRYQCSLSIRGRGRPEHDAADLEAIARATGGRFLYKAGAGADLEFIASHLA